MWIFKKDLSYDIIYKKEEIPLLLNRRTENYTAKADAIAFT